MTSVVFAGTFDPITRGHESIIKKIALRTGGVLVVVGVNTDKTTLFTHEERVKIVRTAFKGIKGIVVADYLDFKDGYLEYLKSMGVKFYARGIRDDKDFAYEEKFRKINETLYPSLQTIYVSASNRYVKLSSTLVREKIIKGKDYKHCVPKKTYATIKRILAEKGL